jgi:iron-sulfur cluster repair protein YtfE (RIC family)
MSILNALAGQLHTTNAPSPDMSVNDALKQWPAAVGALKAMGVETCCGGNASLTAAAAKAGVPLDTLIAALVGTPAR